MGLGFFTGRQWDPVTNHFGALPYIYGTVVTSAVATDMKVRVYGNAAIVTGLNTVKEQLKGKDISGTYAYTDTWVKRPGSWVCVATHASRLAQK